MRLCCEFKNQYFYFFLSIFSTSAKWNIYPPFLIGKCGTAPSATTQGMVQLSVGKEYLYDLC